MTRTTLFAWASFLALVSMFAQPVVANEESSVPGKPRNLAAGADLAGHVTLTWDAPESDGGSPITEYRVYRGTFPDDPVLIGTATDTSFIDASASENAPVAVNTYGVTAVNVVGEGDPSDPSVFPGPAMCLGVFSVIPPDLYINWTCLGVCPLPLPPGVPPIHRRPPIWDIFPC